MTRALIMAGGEDAKWTELGGRGRRHFQVLNGERVLDRLVRQLRANGVEDIGIIAPDMPGYAIPGTYRVEPTWTAWGHEGLNGEGYWSDTDRTLQVYGDTVFADPAIHNVVSWRGHRFQMFGRYGNGPIKGGGGELFAFSFYPEHRDTWKAAVQESFRLRDAGVIKRAGSWEGYRIIGGARGARVGDHVLYPGAFTSIRDGLTDDFDTPRQWRKLKALHERVPSP